jgi:HK97 family phage portal protein
MGMFDAIFKRPKAESAIRGYFQTLTAYQPQFYSYDGGLYEMDITRSAVHAFANHVSKLKPEVLGQNNQRIEKILRYRPNPWQNASQFLYRLATIYEVENTAFIVPIMDMQGKMSGYFPLMPSACDVVQGADGLAYLRYHMKTGETAAMEYSRCGVLTKMQYSDDLFGESNKALKPTMDLISIQNQGIEEGIKQAAAIRFMAKLGQSVRQDDLAAEQKRFRDLNFGTENNGGVLMFDAKYADVKQIDSKPYIVNADQMKIINDNVYNYFGVNEKILRNEWDEASWNAYYEGKIEPFALQLSLALTNMTFSDHEISFGNEIQFSANRLQFATITNKVSVITQLFDRGLISFNEGREILQMPPIDGGDTYMIRGEYVNRNDRTGGGDNADETGTRIPNDAAAVGDSSEETN